MLASANELAFEVPPALLALPPLSIELEGRAVHADMTARVYDFGAIAIALRIDAGGTVYWNETATPLSALQPMLQSELQRDPGNPPLLQIDASGETDYGIVAKVLAAARNADWDRIAFVLE